MRLTWQWAMLALLAAVGIADAAYHYPLLPGRMATHFGPSGAADGWMDKTSFFLFMGFISAFTIGILLLPGTLMRFLPDEMINLPNRDYWLVPERREATMAVLPGYFLSLTVATLALLVAVSHLTYQANLTPVPALGSEAWILLVGYLAFVTVWSVALIRRFAKKQG